MSNTNYLLKRNDEDVPITYTITDQSNNVVDLTGCTANFHVGNQTSIIINNPATITDAKNGVVSYSFTNQDTLYDGLYIAEFVVTFPNGSVLSYPRNNYLTVNIQKNVDTTQTNITLSAIAAKQGDYDAKLQSILSQANSLGLSAMNEWEWTALAGQITYTVPATLTLDANSKWLSVYLGGSLVDPALVNVSATNQLTLNVDPSTIATNTKVIAKWTEPIIPSIDLQAFVKNNMQTPIIETYTATANQTVFNLVNAYSVGYGFTKVTIDGVPQAIATDYTESGPQQITLIEGAVSGAIVKIYLYETDESLSAYISQITPQLNQIMPILGPETLTTKAQTIKGAINEVDASLADMVTDVMNPKYGCKGDGITDDTTAFNSALLDAAGKTLLIPKGYTFIINDAKIPDGTKLTGGGTLKFAPNTSSFAILELGNNVDVEGIIFDGNLANQTTWNESRHAIQIIGKDSVTIRNCRFINLIGDGIYVTSGSTNILIDKNRFIGNNGNRNGISVTNANGVDITNNYFYQMAQNNMPGAIDLEPNSSTDSITNVNIIGNRIIGGSTAQLQKGISINNGQNGTVSEINIENNLIRGAFYYGISVFGGSAPAFVDGVLVANNRIRDTSANIANGCGIIFSNNVNGEIVGNTVINTNDNGIKTVGATFNIVGNTIKKCIVYGIYQLSTSDAGRISDNYIVDCGTNAASAYGGIQTNASNLEITNNKIVSSATTLSQLGLYVAAGTMNFISGNTFKGMGVRSMTIATNPHIIGHNQYDGASGFISVNGTYPPTTGTWQAGQYIFNPNATEQGTAGSKFIIRGWQCTVAGTPGTWVQDRGLTGN